MDEQENNKLLTLLMPPHSLISADVTNDNLDLIHEDLRRLHSLCFVINGPYRGAYAMAHPQIENRTPLRVFVTAERRIIINPRIVNQTKYQVDSIEACMTFPQHPPIRVKRSHKITVEYQTVQTDPDDSNRVILTPAETEELSGPEAKVWQHEIDHLNGKYIYEWELPLIK